MDPPSLDQSPSTEDLYQIDDALGEVFDRVLDALADTDHFGRSTTPSLFIVYAHDNDESGSARAQCVRYLIKWLLAVRSRTLSDKAPLPLWSPRESGNAAAQNILSNQFCLLPRRNWASNSDEEITSVDKVVLCGSQVLKQYFEHEFTSSYINDIVSCYVEAERQRLQPAAIQAQIREKVESQCNEVGFHHVLTELAFLKLRYPNGAAEDDRIIPVTLSEDEMDYMMRDFLKIANCDLRLKFDPSESMAGQHKLFFNLLRQVYAESHTHTVIKAFADCYNNASERLRKTSAITRTVLRDITYNELFKALDAWVRLGSATIRDEAWRSERKSRTQRAFSLRDGIIDWLPKLDDVLDTQNDNLYQRHGGTGAWILADKKYEKWRYSGSDEQTDPLWCYGKPGAGKTIISSIIIEDLENHMVEPSTAVAYVFCKHGEDQTAWSLMLSLVAQLARQRHEFSPKLINVAQKCKARKPPVPPKPYECEQILEAEVGQFEKVFFVVDALDERLNNNDAYHLLGTLLKTTAKVLVTSRFAESISVYFPRESRIEIQAQSEDVKAYIEFRCEQPAAHLLRRMLDKKPTLKAYIVETLLTKTDGMFLLPRMNMDLLLDEIKRYRSEVTVESVIKTLPSALQKAYDEYIRRILASDTAEHASDVLAWVLFAKQPAQIKVVQEAISLQRHRNRINDLIDGSDLLEYCIGLLVESVTGPSRGTLTFVHSDTERYFRDPKISAKIQGWFPNGQRRIASSCLRCLVLLDDAEVQTKSPLWRYAAQYWGYHIQDNYAELEPLISEYLSQPEKVSSAMRQSMLESPPEPIVEAPWLSSHSRPRPGFTFYDLCQHKLPSCCYGWHAAAFFGISQYFHAAGKGDIECRDSNGWTPLWWALLGKQDTTVELLLKKGAKTSTKSDLNIPLAAWVLGVEEIMSPSFAVEDEVVNDKYIAGEVVRLPAWLSFSNIMQAFGNRTWRIATEKSTFRVIDTLHDDEVNTEDSGGNTLLMTASRLWQWDVARLLLAKGADKSRRNKSGASAFSLALKDRQRSFGIQNLVATGNSRSKIGPSIVLPRETTLNPYNFGKLEKRLETMLLELLPPDLQADSHECRRALRLAVTNRHSRVVQELLQRGADPNTRYEDGSTPLLLSCMPPIMHRFHVSDIRVKDTALLHVGLHVTAEQHNRIFEEMFGLKASPLGTTDLPHEVEEDDAVSLRPFDSIVQMLLERKAHIDAIHGVFGLSALALAAQYEYLTLFRTLLAKGADITQSGVDLPQITKLLKKEITSNGVYGRATLGTLGDFETHDYCVLLLGFVIPGTYHYCDKTTTSDQSRCLLGNVLDIRRPLPLRASYESRSSAKTMEHWTPQKEYERRVKANKGRELEKLLGRIETAIKRADAKLRLEVCLRDEFWAFGTWGWSFPDAGAHSPEQQTWIRQWQIWTGLVCCGLLGINTSTVLDVPSFRLRPPYQRFKIEAYGVGLRQKEDFWTIPGTSSQKLPQLSHLLLKSFLVWSHVDNAVAGRPGLKKGPGRSEHG